MKFEDWFYEPEGFCIKAERFYEDIDVFARKKPEVLVEWLRSAFEAGQSSTSNECYWDPIALDESKLLRTDHEPNG